MNMWTLKEWKATYNLFDEHGKPCAPPKPGECFAVEIEL